MMHTTEVFLNLATVNLLGNAEVAAGLGDVDLITLHGGMVRVMTMVRDPPAEVGSPQEGVGDEANNIANPLVSRECTVATL
jgi:hypothetical protein